MKKRNIFAVLGGALVLGIAYVLTTVVTLVSLVLPVELANKHEA